MFIFNADSSVDLFDVGILIYYYTVGRPEDSLTGQKKIMSTLQKGSLFFPFELNIICNVIIIYYYRIRQVGVYIIRWIRCHVINQRSPIVYLYS